jgi:alkylation response protein AidB-like acyl-CoA dehydrogenase
VIAFDLADEQREIQRVAREFAERVLLPKAAVRDRTGEFPTGEIEQLGGLGLLGINVPLQYGGAEAGVVAYSLAMTEIGRGDASLAVAMSVTNMVAEILCRFGTDEQKRRFVPILTGGQPGAFALSEPQAGSDPSAMTTTATRTAGGWRLDGAKQWITTGDRAAVVIVWAKTDTKKISTFIVPGGTRGMTAGKHEDKMGIRGSSTVPLIFDGCELPEDALLGQPGGGLSVALAALDGGRIGIASQSLGIGRAALEAATAYARVRAQFGKPLADFQATQLKLADMATQLEAARLLTLRAAWLKEQGRPFTKEASMAKVWSSETAGRVCDHAVQIHGGYGYTREYPVERLLRDARVTRIYEGTSEVQRIVIARSLVGKA